MNQAQATHEVNSSKVALHVRNIIRVNWALKSDNKMVYVKKQSASAFWRLSLTSVLLLGLRLRYRFDP